MKLKFLQRTLFFLAFVVLANLAYAQPANDECSTAEEISMSADLASAVWTSGTTVDATASDSVATPVCSGSWFRDDVWYEFTTGATVPENGIIVKYRIGTVVACGLAVYPSCESLSIGCFSTDDPEENELLLYPGVLEPETTYKVRVWSGASPSDNSGTFELTVFPNPNPLSTDNVIWDEGDFNGGMNGWTAVAISSAQPDSSHNALWVWDAIGAVHGAYAGAGTAISSPTSANGAMVFDSDWYDTGGVAGAFGTGICPSAQVGELISPTIDLSEVTVAGVSVKFYQLFRNYIAGTWVSYSIDNGETWIDTQVNTDVDANASAPDEPVRLFLPGAVGHSEVKIKFTWNGDFYHWVIDDVQLVETEANNLRVNPWYATAPNAITPTLPKNQFTPMYFMADVRNVGALPQDSSNLNVTIIKDSVEVFTADLDYGTIVEDTTVENLVFAETFTTDVVGTYSGAYTISAVEEDFDLEDNTQEFEFKIGGNQFAKCYGATRTLAPAGFSWTDENPHSWAIGNVYYIKDGDGVSCTSLDVQFASSITELAGKEITYKLYKLTNDDNNNMVDNSELTTVAFGSVVVTDSTSTDIITVPLVSTGEDEDNVILESGATYVAMMEYTATGAETPTIAASTAIDYGAVSFLHKPTEDFDGGGLAQGEITFGSYLLAVVDNAEGTFDDAEYAFDDFGGTIVPLIRMNLGEPTFPDSASDLLEDVDMNVYPNPAQGSVNLDFDLGEKMNDVSIKITDISGRVLFTKSLGAQKSAKVNFNTVDMAAGQYMISILTEKGSQTEKFTVIK